MKSDVTDNGDFLVTAFVVTGAATGLKIALVSTR